MKRTTLLIAVLVAAVFAAGQAPAQISPVKLSVNKNRKVSQQTTHQNTGGGWDYYGGYREKKVEEKTYYTVEVANASTGPVPNIQIKWAILIKPANNGKPQVVEGERTCSLNLGQKFSFDTDLVELSGTKWETGSGQYRRNVSSEIAGYVVEAFVGGKRVAADVQPADAKRKIDDAREGKDRQKTHQF